MNAMDVALICKALGDANRLEIVKMLSDGEKCGCKLLERFEITQPTLSHHMKILVECGRSPVHIPPKSSYGGMWTGERPQGRKVAALLSELRNPDPVQRIYRGTDLLRLRL